MHQPRPEQRVVHLPPPSQTRPPHVPLLPQPAQRLRNRSPLCRKFSLRRRPREVPVTAFRRATGSQNDHRRELLPEDLGVRVERARTGHHDPQVILGQPRLSRRRRYLAAPGPKLTDSNPPCARRTSPRRRCGAAPSCGHGRGAAEGSELAVRRGDLASAVIAKLTSRKGQLRVLVFTLALLECIVALKVAAGSVESNCQIVLVNMRRLRFHEPAKSLPEYEH